MRPNNAGLDGATTYRHLILMEDYVVTLRPKVVLFLIGINDVGAGNLEAAASPPEHYLRRRWRALLYRSEVYALGQNLSATSWPRAGDCTTRKLT